MALPSTYQEVEYIQSSGTQYINTGYTPSTSTNFRMKLNVVSGPNQWNCFIGSRNSTSGSVPHYWLGWNNGSGYQGSLVCLFYPTMQYSYTSVGTITIGSDTVLSFENKILTKDSLSSTINYTSAPSYPLFLFAGNTGGSASDYANIKLYYCKIYNGSTLVRDFVPCYRKSDNVVGLYDTVNNVFYTNAGTGTFTVGPTPSQSGKIKKFLLGTSLIRPRPTEITEVVNTTAYDGGHTVYKPGYKIKSVTFDFQGYYSGSAWRSTRLRICDNSSSTELPSVEIKCYLGGTWGYNYNDGAGSYGGFGILYSGGQNYVLQMNGSSTSSTQNAGSITFTNTSYTYNIGKTTGNWTQTGTGTWNSTQQGYINQIFNSTAPFLITTDWNGSNMGIITLARYTITYESL